MIFGRLTTPQPKNFVPFNDVILNLYWGKVGRTVCTISPSWMARRANNPQPCIADLPKHTVFFSVFWNKLIHEHLHQRMKRCTQIIMMHSLIQNWYVKMLITMELQVIMVPKGESRMLQLCRNADFNTISWNIPIFGSWIVKDPKPTKTLRAFL
jgi:hypothetical protein